MILIKKQRIIKTSATRRQYHHFCIAIVSLFGMALPLKAMSLDEQRTNYDKAMTAIEGNDLKTFEQLKSTLDDYPLYPYLDYRQLTQQLPLMTLQQMREFEQKYALMPFMNTVRGLYLQQLAKNNNWADLLKYQTRKPIGQSYQCNYYYANSQLGDKQLALSGAKSLYLSGSSIDSACDKLFDFLKANGELDNTLIFDRMLLAFKEGSGALLLYLQKELTGDAVKYGEQIVSLYRKPASVALFSSKSTVTSYNQRLTRLAFGKLIKKNPKEAVSQFDTVTQGQLFDKDVRQDMADILVSSLMSTDDEALAIWRDLKLSSTKKQSLLERRFRLALVNSDWKNMDRWLGMMSEKETQNLTWRYWQARIALQKGNKASADLIFASMTGQRHFYSVAAAMYLNQEIDIPFQTAVLNTDNLKPFSSSLTRIAELIAVNKTYDSKREWQYLLKRADQEQKAMLAAFALDKRWYHLSVQATITGKLWEHLEFRFPVAHRWWFEFFSKERGLPLTTLLALSRQESAFYTKAVSPVGARGLMQLMPATAKETSKKLGLEYLGKMTLNDPGTNIQLGSGYLRMLLDNFEENRILAFAAYNAGPHRVKTWLDKSKGNLDVIAFIEAIPFYETRGYVQNVLMYEIYYRKLLGMPLNFLTKNETEKNY